MVPIHFGRPNREDAKKIQRHAGRPMHDRMNSDKKALS